MGWDGRLAGASPSLSLAASKPPRGSPMGWGAMEPGVTYWRRLGLFDAVGWASFFSAHAPLGWASSSVQLGWDSSFYFIFLLMHCWAGFFFWWAEFFLFFLLCRWA
jgi:hypothetical protein